MTAQDTKLDIQLHELHHTATINGLKPVRLGRAPFAILKAMLERAGDGPISREEFEKIIGYSPRSEQRSNVVQVYVRRLREKLDPDDVIKPIQCVSKEGYYIRMQILSDRTLEFYKPKPKELGQPQGEV